LELNVGLTFGRKRIKFFKNQKIPLGRTNPFQDMDRWACINGITSKLVKKHCETYPCEKLGHFGVCETYGLLQCQYWGKEHSIRDLVICFTMHDV
jgi:hypothetical protein